MATCNMPRVLLAAPHSGSGKTTVMCALLEVLRRQGMTVAAFKSGPDYIDAMFHSRILGTPSHNLDLFLFGRGRQGCRTARTLLAHNSCQADIAVLEGAMGFYDGVGLTSEASAYDLARAVAAPVIFVVDGKGAALSLAAQIRGLAQFRDDSQAIGFIVNTSKAGVYEYYKKIWEQETGLEALGYMPYVAEGSLSSRHLGLITADEVGDLQCRVRALAETAASTLQWQRIVELAKIARPFTYEEELVKPVGTARIAVAKDEAFCFYYDDELRLFQQLGAEIVYFSPLHDTALPPCNGIYIGGGYPELYARHLADNESMRSSLRQAIERNIPCFAECGGFMYLMEHFKEDGRTYDWAGVIPGTTYMTDTLTRFGYITVTAQKDTLLCNAGETITAHEFHYSDSTCNGDACEAHKASGKRHWPCIYAKGNLFAGYPHMHLWGNIDWARNFIKACCKAAQGH
ncbi:MAG: cobyrinate a,c-diamide synthase [Megasphaera sp.]|nr:cobyrinate a,c-diamide synthase [Megasphaera sp.]MCH4217321.1 cobyrinate a,c-diamide synthase [Megasphaera sp.]